MVTLARWCYAHRRSVVAGWLVLLIALGAGTAAIGSAYNDEFQLPGTESAKALELLTGAFPQEAGDVDRIVLHATDGTLADPARQARIETMLAQVATLPEVAGVSSPFGPQGAGRISQDGTIAYAEVRFDKRAQVVKLDNIKKVVSTARSANGDGLQVELSGQAVAAIDSAPPASSELVGLAAAAVVLLLAFGSVAAMLLPLLTAVAALGAGILSLGLVSHLYSIGTVSPTLAALIGLGVGIDYALFIVTRYRRGLLAGQHPRDAVVTAVNTSGRAVLFAGATVVVALLGLLVLRVDFLTGLGTGAALTVVWTVAAAVTLLPALLGFLGLRVLSRSERRRLAASGPVEHDADAPGGWNSWARFVARRRTPLSIVALLLIAVLALPTLQLRLGISDAGNNPTSSTTRQAYDLLATGFGPGSNGPLQIVAETPTDADRAAFRALVSTVSSLDGVASATAVPTPPGSALSLASVVPTTAPQDEGTSRLIQTLRTDVVPAAEAGNGMQAYVGGVTAIFDDFADELTSKLPLFLGVIVALGFVLLLVAFRSLMVPLVAAVMNLLAAAASFGVVVTVFQLGFGLNLLNLGAGGPIEAFLPVIMLAILFGLSMDYQVFLVSRMHEEWLSTGDNTRAVRVGQAETGRVITAAATIMIAVFAAFILGGQRVIAEFGIGLASAVAIDAFILRTVLVPALMQLLGRANWWLPGWLDRVLPRLSIEAAEVPPEADPDRTPEPALVD